MGEFLLRNQCFASRRIPPAFMKHIPKEASSKRRAILEGPSSKVWHVELSEKINGTYLQDGWQEFSKAHFLRVSDFLVFRYDGNMHFTVLIFDKTACEREYNFTSDNFQEKTFFHGPKKQGRLPRKTACERGDIFSRDNFQEQTFFHGPKKRGRPPRKSLNFVPVVSQQKACKFDLKRHPSDLFQGKCNPSPKPEGAVRIETRDLDMPASVAGRVHYLQRREQVMLEEKGKVQERASSFTSDFPLEEKGKVQERASSFASDFPLEEKGKVQERASSFTSDFPFFTKIMSVRQVRRGFIVDIPNCFARAHLPNERVKMILQVPKGKAWEVHLVVYNNDRYFISGGWTAFARGNNLEEGDSCIFEIVGKLKMCVHIFRLSEENKEKAQIKSQAS
ncbi:B3 domain-containing protein Os01g0723500-like isoform X2 [Tasmannia lanceolata]|uniref:B3 domain-containing protein Os01g0723500-like isoform X2 n=1 Tax=Tasmannia lanceolata TaxID=3420 RepID=UPI004063AD64